MVTSSSGPEVQNLEDYVNIFLKYRDVNGVVKWNSISNQLISFYENRNSLIRLDGYSVRDSVQLGDSLSSELFNPELKLFRKDANGDYQLIESDCPSIFKECDGRGKLKDEETS